MAELKTKENTASVEKFLKGFPAERRKDAITIVELMQKATRWEPKMWGSSIIGFGSYHYKYASGHEGDMCILGFSPRKQNFSFYLCGGVTAFEEDLKKLGKYKTGKGCLYINKLADIDTAVLKTILKKSADLSKKTK
jgi:hypothetical protein